MIELRDTKIEKVCATGKGAVDVLKNVHFVPNRQLWKDGRWHTVTGAGMVIATNGFAAAFVPVEHGEDAEGSIPVEAIRAARKQGNKMGVNGVASLENGQTFPLYEGEGRFPDMCVVVGHLQEDTVKQVTVDAKRLHDLADAICESGRKIVTLSLTEDPKQGILVTSVYDRDNFGVMMPCYDSSYMGE